MHYFCLIGQQPNGRTLYSEQKLWQHVVTVDRLAWEERDGIKKVNKLVDDQAFVRRLYIDITGKVPTYEQFTKFLKDKNVNKRQKLIDQLLGSTGYVSNFTTFWLDLLRGPPGWKFGRSLSPRVHSSHRALFTRKPTLRQNRQKLDHG